MQVRYKGRNSCFLKCRSLRRRLKKLAESNNSAFKIASKVFIVINGLQRITCDYNDV